VTPTEGPLRRQYWDSCLYINYLSNLDTAKADTIDQLLTQAEATRPAITILVSPIVIAEVRPHERYEADRSSRIEEMFEFDRPYMESFATTTTIARLAREIGLDQPGLTVLDTLHVATAIIAKADVLFTYDGDKEKGRRRRSGDLLKYDGLLGRPPLKIQVPWVYSGPMDDALRQLASQQAISPGTQPIA
jgi:hypothetical protein